MLRNDMDLCVLSRNRFHTEQPQAIVFGLWKIVKWKKQQQKCFNMTNYICVPSISLTKQKAKNDPCKKNLQVDYANKITDESPTAY